MKLHMVLIGVLFVGLMVTGIMNFISEGVNSMEDPTSSGFQESTLQSFRNNQELINRYEDQVNNETASSSEEASGDILGALFGRGYQQVREGGISENLNMYSNIVNDSVSEVTILGGFRDNVVMTISGALLILFFVGFLLYFFIGKERV